MVRRARAPSRGFAPSREIPRQRARRKSQHLAAELHTADRLPMPIEPVRRDAEALGHLLHREQRLVRRAGALVDAGCLPLVDRSSSSTPAGTETVCCGSTARASSSSSSRWSIVIGQPRPSGRSGSPRAHRAPRTEQRIVVGVSAAGGHEAEKPGGGAPSPGRRRPRETSGSAAGRAGHRRAGARDRAGPGAVAQPVDEARAVARLARAQVGPVRGAHAGLCRRLRSECGRVLVMSPPPAAVDTGGRLPELRLPRRSSQSNGTSTKSAGHSRCWNASSIASAWSAQPGRRPTAGTPAIRL